MPDQKSTFYFTYDEITIDTDKKLTFSAVSTSKSVTESLPLGLSV